MTDYNNMSCGVAAGAAVRSTWSAEVMTVTPASTDTANSYSKGADMEVMQEDRALIEAVKRMGARNWESIAQFIASSTNKTSRNAKSCRLR